MHNSHNIFLKCISALLSGAMLLVTASIVVGSYVFSFSSHAQPLIDPLSDVLAPLSENTAVHSFVDFNATASAALSSTLPSATVESMAAFEKSFAEGSSSFFSFVSFQAKALSVRLFRLVVAPTQTAPIQIATEVTSPSMQTAHWMRSSSS